MLNAERVESSYQAQKIKVSLAALKSKVSKKILQKRALNKGSHFFKLSKWPYVFAALGGGVNLETASKRSKVPLEVCRLILNAMLDEGLVSHDPTCDKYRASVDYLDFGQLGLKDGYRDLYFDVLENVRSEVKQNFSSEEKLFHCSLVSVNKRDLAKFKKALNRLVSDFSADVEEPDGDYVATLQLSLF